MDNPASINLFSSILIGLSLGLFSGLLGAFFKWLLKHKGVAAPVALIAGTILGATLGSGLLLSADQHSTAMVGSSFLLGAITPWILGTRLFHIGEDAEHSASDQ